MKKFFKYTIVFIVTMIAFICKVNAGVSCTPGVTIKEVSAASPAGFDVIMPICGKEEYAGHAEIHNGSNYPNEVAYAFEEVQTYYRNVDNKSSSVANVPRCDHPLVYLKAIVSYRITAKGRFICPNGYKKRSWGDSMYVTASFDERCYKDVYTDICTSKGDKTSCLKQNQGGIEYCKWVESEDSSSSSSGTSNDTGGGNNSGGGINHQETTYDYTSNPSIQRTGATTVVEPSGKCEIVKKKHTEESAAPVDYECIDGFTKVAGSSVEYRNCELIISKPTGGECLKGGYHYTGKSGKNVCKSGGDDKLHIDEKAEKVLDDYIHFCTDEYNAKKGDVGNGIYEMSSCEKVGVDYVLYCPKYSCTKWDERFSACTPTFSADGNRAYCVNPDQPYASEGKADKSFNVTDCKSSFNTVDCGYSNILIEGNWCSKNKSGSAVNDKAIEMAMRLWAVHTGQSGFSGPGLSLKRGSSCGQSVWYMRNSQSYNNGFYNVYDETYKYAKSAFFANASRYFKEGYLDPTDSSIYGNFGIGCSALNTKYDRNGEIKSQTIVDKNKYGVACGGNSHYKAAITLLFSTILGNNKMEEHLYDLYGDTKTIDPTYAEFEEIEDKDNTENTKHTIIVRFEPTTFEKAFKYSEGTEIKCSDLKPGTDEYKALSPYCQIETEIYNGSGKRLYGGDIDYCEKHVGCYDKNVLKGLLVCSADESKKPTSIKIKYKISPAKDSVVKYVSCSSPSSHQILYGFKKKSSEDVTTINVKTNVKEYEIVGFPCGNEYCDETGLTITKKACKSNFSNYDGANTSSIKDPSLKCISRYRNLTRRGYYDFSDTFHVNTDFCRIYCSDEINYTIADKVKEKTGRNFIYNIPLTGTAFAGKKLEHPLTAIVEEKRTCMSKIFYNDLTETILQIREKYGLTQEDLPATYAIKCSEVDSYTNKGIRTYVTKKSGKCASARRPVNFVDLLKVLVDKAHSENSRSENVKQVLYDLYNCNLYKSGTKNNNFGEAVKNSDTTSSTTKIKKPQDNIYGNVRSEINKQYSASKNYGLDGCKITTKDGKITDNNCIVHSPIKYGFGSEVDGKKVEMGSIATASSSVGTMKYCSGKGCFDYKKNDKDAYKYGKSDTKNKVIDSSSKSILGKNFGLNNLGFSSINIPTNDYAYFEIKFAVGFYNKSRFVPEPVSGKVYYEGSSALNKKVEYLPNDPYTFPTSTNAYNYCSKVAISKNGKKVANAIIVEGVKQAAVNEFNEKYTRCSINQEFETVATFFRKRKYNDDFVNEISKNQKFGCYVDVLFPETVMESEAFDYRSADPASLFPYDSDKVKDKTKVMGYNWITKEGQAARTYIESTSDELRTTNKLLDYTIVLTPEQIKNIQEYNSTAPKYIDDPVDIPSCKTVPDKYDKNGRIIEYGYYYDCKSVFLDKIGSSKKALYGTIETYKRD